MMNLLTLSEQEEFESNVHQIQKRASQIWALRENGPLGPHFTNHLELANYGSGKAVVKTSKKLSEILFKLETINLIFHGLPAEFMDNESRLKYEKHILEYLNEQGLNVPELVYSDAKGAVTTLYLAHTPIVENLRGQDQEQTIARLTEGLMGIHDFGMHGGASVYNAFIHNGKRYWSDFERFQKTGAVSLLLHDLHHFIQSVSKHSHIPLRKAEEIVLDAYKKLPVRRAYMPIGFG
ncbi:hypothetical protein J4227_03245 [Candidatus Woesearchaeota archaeon]|nr:hypothetical protein [Candidatus Woesearchaeota archaeon]